MSFKNICILFLILHCSHIYGDEDIAEKVLAPFMKEVSAESLKKLEKIMVNTSIPEKTIATEIDLIFSKERDTTKALYEKIKNRHHNLGVETKNKIINLSSSFNAETIPIFNNIMNIAQNMELSRDEIRLQVHGIVSEIYDENIIKDLKAFLYFEDNHFKDVGSLSLIGTSGLIIEFGTYGIIYEF